MIHLGAICQAMLLAGCSESMPLGVATGTVRYRGETVTEGIVSFYSPELGVGREATINAAGLFSVSRLPFGPYRIAIHPPLVLQDFGGKSAPSMEPKQVANIPEKYRNPSTSGFACDVARRSMQMDLHME